MVLITPLHSTETNKNNDSLFFSMEYGKQNLLLLKNLPVDLAELVDYWLLLAIHLRTSSTC